MLEADHFDYAHLDATGNAARHYDPETGRWINVEPVGYEAGDVNPYRYVGNAPCNVSDPTGNALPADPKT